MTVQQIKDYVASLCDDLSFAYFTDTELTRYVNQELGETAKVLNQSGNNWYVKTNIATSTVANQQGYTLPTDFVAVNRLEWVLNINTTNEAKAVLQPITLNQQSGFDLYASPQCYYLIGASTINLVPIPTSVRTLRLFYTYRPAEITLNSETPDVPLQYHEYLAKRVAKLCFIKDGRDASLLMEDIKKVEDYMKWEAEQRVLQTPRRVVERDYDGTGIPF